MTTTPTRSLADLQDMLGRHDSEPAGLPVHPRLAPVFPRGLRLGAVHALSGSLAVAAGLLAAPTQQGWCAAVGLPELSLESVGRWGGALDQLVLVPAPGRSPWDAVGTLVDAADLIVARSAPIAPAQARRLEARLRARQSVLVVVGEWPQPAVTIRSRTIGWAGLGQGTGCITEQHLELSVTERHRRHTSRLVLPVATMSTHPGGRSASPVRSTLVDAPVRVLLVRCPAWSITAARAAHDIAADAELALVDKGVVVACSEAAEREGVTTGLRIRQAQHRCPDMIVLPHDPDLDRRVFEPVVQMIEQVVPGVHLVRPGVAAVRAKGPSRFYGGDHAAAQKLLEHLRAQVTHDVRLAVADGLFAAEQAARSTTSAEPIALVHAGGSGAFLAPLSVSAATAEMNNPRMAKMLRRMGVRTLGDLATLPAADVHSRFGPVGLQVHQLACGHDLPTLAPREIPVDLSSQVVFDPSAQDSEHVVATCSPAVDQLLHRVEQETSVCTAVRITVHASSGAPSERLWRHPWHFTAADVLDRLRWQLNDLGASHAGSLRADEGGRDREITAVALALESVVPAQHQAEGLWGARPDEHVIQAITTLQHRLGHEGVLSGSLGGGRLLHERRLLRPWGEPAPTTTQRRDDQPWPGQLPGPAPAVVFDTAQPVALLSSSREPIVITERGSMSAEPVWFVPRLGRAGGNDVPAEGAVQVLAWAGPWPVRQRWWRRGPAFDRVQLVDEHQQAWLLLHDSGHWWAEARYD